MGQFEISLAPRFSEVMGCIKLMSPPFLTAYLVNRWNGCDFRVRCLLHLAEARC